MLAWSPEQPRNKPQPKVQWAATAKEDGGIRPAAPGGYEYSATNIRGFSLTHLMGTGCTGASGDIPFVPFVGSVQSSPSTDEKNAIYASQFSHSDETAAAGYYRVKLANGVNVELTASPRTGGGRFTYPVGQPAVMLVRTSDSETGSTDATVKIDAATRTISGSVTAGNFCGYLDGTVNRRGYYTLFFVAHFDQSFLATGTWQDSAVRPGTTGASGGTTFGTLGFPAPGKGSGGWVVLDTEKSPVVNVRVGISYVSEENAEANLVAENPKGTSFETLRQRAHSAWNDALGHIDIGGGSADQRTVFYTALYHTLLGQNLSSDVDGRYRGMDQKIHTVSAPQKAQYSTFSGWDVYRSQLQLVTFLMPDVGSDIAHSLLNYAEQNGGEWDRWIHNSSFTRVMNGDPSATAIADIVAFGGESFDVKSAYRSLLRAATVPTQHDLSKEGCPLQCVGQRPSLDLWMKLHYMPVGANGWIPASDTLEYVASDFAISQLARHLGDKANEELFLERAQYWKNIFNPNATSHGGYFQNRNADGSWPGFDPANARGFVEGSAAQYLWMIPFNERGLFDMLGGNDATNARLDAFFHNPDGSWAVTESGGLHAELNNEPSIETPWLYDYSGQPWKTQETVRYALNKLWTNGPHGMPGNDDLGEMSSWYVWSAMGFYPETPGRAELVLGSPLFPEIHIHRALGDIFINSQGAAPDAPYIHSLKVNGNVTSKTWLAESFVKQGGKLEFVLSSVPDRQWGTGVNDAPPSFAPLAK
jgi:predicted alpha-1,2-mannosidase